ncbi:hypothetical protein K443DRAFT_115027, partial [Laccaria amethystina LaAM-08-1]
RSTVKSIACPIVEAAYGLGVDKDKHELQNEIEVLLDQLTYLYKNSEPHQGLLCHPVIQVIINKLWFKNKNDQGATHVVFAEIGIPIATLALVIRVVSSILDEWQTGEYCKIQFSANAYIVFKNSVQFSFWTFIRCNATTTSSDCT